jgi:hypothetical protein
MISPMQVIVCVINRVMLLVGLEELKKRSQVVQRGLPRPTNINHAILRPSDPQMNELQKVSISISQMFN